MVIDPAGSDHSPPGSPLKCAIPTQPDDANREISCDRVNALLGEYHAGALSDSEQTALEGHLIVCSECGRRAEAYFEVIRMAGSLTPKRPSPEAEARLRRLLAKAAEAKPQTSPPDEPTTKPPT